MDVMHLSTKVPVRDVIHKVAVEGVLGLILIQWRNFRDKLVTLHTFINGSKTKEYDGISVEAATYIMQKERSQNSQVSGPPPPYSYNAQPQMKFNPELQEPPPRDVGRYTDFDKNTGLISNLSTILAGLSEARNGPDDRKNSLLDMLKSTQKKHQYETRMTTADPSCSGDVNIDINPREMQRSQLNKNFSNVDFARNSLLQPELQLLNSSAESRTQPDSNSAQIDTLKLSYALSQILNASGDRPPANPPLSDRPPLYNRPAQKSTGGVNPLFRSAFDFQQCPTGSSSLNNASNNASQRDAPTQQPYASKYGSADLLPDMDDAALNMGAQVTTPGRAQTAGSAQESVANVLERLKQLYQTQTQVKEARAFM